MSPLLALQRPQPVVRGIFVGRHHGNFIIEMEHFCNQFCPYSDETRELLQTSQAPALDKFLHRTRRIGGFLLDPGNREIGLQFY
jgi:hypothetical protein